MKKNLTITTIIAFVLSVGAAMAQQRPQYSQYVLNNYLHNPAVGGIENYADIRTGYRAQWIGLEGAPKSFYASAHTMLGQPRRTSNPKSRRINRYGFTNKNSLRSVSPHHGIGMFAQVDKAGLLNTSTFNVSYAYHLPISRYINLSSGISTGLSNYSVKTGDAIYFDTNDAYLTGAVPNTAKLDLGVGFWLYSPDFYIGLSGTQLVPDKQDPAQQGNGDAAQFHRLRQAHYYATAGMRMHFSKELAFVPSLMLKKTSTSAVALDLNAKLMYDQKYWAGLSYRHQDAVAVLAGASIGDLFDLAYSYDFTTSELNKYSAGSHEVVLGFKLNNRNRETNSQWVW
ncbi:PorP/SprF family type IX secretion system membrane protein [Pontibacter harenae]|uniref:PorP/SprF family type IX secretion system membrane protein n=1 Tax=Pontibacter harenae TaxID=2894083 RepID=UPI001E2D4440|nr:type IX secretion system membrane protein PorP/SprF [Pontibacter harenae]MCC9166099.1 type IX secretion system membrane protein PorP/SprF [Pontibacter harenae]